MARGEGVAGRYEVRLVPAAAREYRKLRGPVKEGIGAAIDELADDPRPRGAAKLAGRDDFRIRVGDHRVVYAIDEDARTVTIARIAHRREVYRR